MQQFLQNTSDDFGIKIDVTKAAAGTVCQAGAKVSANYTGSFTDGTIFDSSTIAKFGHVTPFNFGVGEGQVIQCWDYAIERMAPGESAQILCPADTAYGTRGAGSAIPPNANLTFDMHVISC